MKKFFMLTRGRTGSTAILDEIGTTSVLSLQELFVRFEPSMQENLSQDYPLMAPFDLWMAPDWHGNGDGAGSRKGECGQRPHFLARSLHNRVKLFHDNSRAMGRAIERHFLRRYLENVEALAQEENKSALIFKILSHQFVERRPLLGVLKSLGYKAILLVRRNVVRQVLSGMIAEKRGVYNSRVAKTLSPCHIDLDRFEFSVAWEMKCNEENRALLKENGIEYLEIAYEDFCHDREKLYLDLFSFMNIDYHLPESTSFSVMVPSIRDAVTNYDELEARVSAMFSL